MDKITRETIVDFARDIVIGSGMGPEWAEQGHEPDEDALRALSRLLGHKLSGEEIHVFQVEWDRCLQECAQE